ncbi:hypothetical protein [Nitrosomonas ureae]|nr:hypothetical protein [Nitrosomonas ureae]
MKRIIFGLGATQASAVGLVEGFFSSSFRQQQYCQFLLGSFYPGE